MIGLTRQLAERLVALPGGHAALCALRDEQMGFASHASATALEALQEAQDAQAAARMLSDVLALWDVRLDEMPEISADAPGTDGRPRPQARSAPPRDARSIGPGIPLTPPETGS